MDEIPVSECEGLFAIANAAGGGTPFHWFQSNTPCNWSGIGCVDGHVNYLEISGSIWPDVLPAEIEKLERLEVLAIVGGTFTSLPPEIGNLKLGNASLTQWPTFWLCSIGIGEAGKLDYSGSLR